MKILTSFQALAKEETEKYETKLLSMYGEKLTTSINIELVEQSQSQCQVVCDETDEDETRAESNAKFSLDSVPTMELFSSCEIKSTDVTDRADNSTAIQIPAVGPTITIKMKIFTDLQPLSKEETEKYEMILLPTYGASLPTSIDAESTEQYHQSQCEIVRNEIRTESNANLGLDGVPTTTTELLRVIEPTLSSGGKSTMTAEAKPTITSEAKPTITSEAKPTITSEAKPTITSEAKPTITITSEAKPTITMTPEAKPATTPQAKPSMTPEAKPAITLQAKPSMTPEEPAITPQAKPTTMPQVKPTVTPEAKGEDKSLTIPIPTPAGPPMKLKMLSFQALSKEETEKHEVKLLSIYGKRLRTSIDGELNEQFQACDKTDKIKCSVSSSSHSEFSFGCDIAD